MFITFWYCLSTLRPSSKHLLVFSNAVLRKPPTKSGYMLLMALRRVWQSWRSCYASGNSYRNWEKDWAWEEEEEKWCKFVNLLACSHDQVLCFFSLGSGVVCIVEMPQDLVVVINAELGPHALLLDEREIFNFSKTALHFECSDSKSTCLLSGGKKTSWCFLWFQTFRC